MFDITKLFKKENPVDINVLNSMEKDELLKLARENKIEIYNNADKNAIIEAIKKFVEQKRIDTEEPKKVFKYRCKEECTFQKKFRRPGDIVFLPEKKNVPHFEFVE